ncbi:FAD-dependent oxidoreductase [Rhodococcus sp. OK302]|uniref:FAD-dependent oxidoreductase n=1 Tax=Rhodococcus sp. OK302 TaxID=1882769 RepID=UPI000B940496|nr:FAD-dependent oxidoreductase [Rhodococcus sp. OK302]OYD69225.1 assimilatory nitrate reductase electron transfer subunit [Rhodococcus sp. OK302]
MKRVVIVGNGMAGSRVAEELRRRMDAEALDIVLIGAEDHAPYNRILLSNVLAGSITARDTRLKTDEWWARARIDVRAGTAVTAIDPDLRTVTCSDGAAIGYDELILATGSSPFIPPVLGLAECASRVATFRTLDDCARITEAATPGSRAVVLGAGLLGIEAARGLRMRGVDVTVVHPKDFPMERQMDSDGGAVLTRTLEGVGIEVVLGRRVSEFSGDSVVLDDGSQLRADLLVLSAGIRPCVELAQQAGAAVGYGVLVDDELRTDVDGIRAIGECAEHRGEVYGLVQPGWEQAAVVADLLTGADPKASYSGTPTLTRLKAHDIDLASMGDVSATMHSLDVEVTTLADASRGSYAKIVVKGERIVGALLLGVPDVVGTLTQLFDAQLPVPPDRIALLTGRGATGPIELASPSGMPGSAVICRCNSVTKTDLTRAWKAGARSEAALASATRATTGCGGCSSSVAGICEWLSAADPVSPDNSRETQEEGAA